MTFGRAAVAWGAAAGGPLLHGRCGRGWADDSEEEGAQNRRKQKLVFFNTNKIGNQATGGAAAAIGKRERPMREGRCYRAAVGGLVRVGRCGRAAAEGTLRKGRYGGRAAAGGPPRAGRCGRAAAAWLLLHGRCGTAAPGEPLRKGHCCMAAAEGDGPTIPRRRMPKIGENKSWCFLTPTKQEIKQHEGQP